MTVCNGQIFQLKNRQSSDVTSEIDDKRRIVTKQGNYRVTIENVDKNVLKSYFLDAFTTLVDAKWRWSLLIFILGFMLTWIGFALLYLLFSYLHGDTELSNEEGEITPCISNVYDFTTAFLFSLETQHTIGYGSRGTTTECPHVVFTVFLQFIIGVGVQCLTAALVFTKLQRSKKRGGTILFSHRACLGYVDGQWRLMIRVGDFRRSQLLNVKATGILIKRVSFQDTEQEFLEQEFIIFKSEGGSEILTLLWPAVMYHNIDESSPLWPPDKLREFGGFAELVVMLEGVIESTSRVMQVRTSYLPEEIQVGYKFQAINPQVTEDGKYHCSYFDMNTVCPVMASNTPRRKRKISTMSFT